MNKTYLRILAAALFLLASVTQVPLPEAGADEAAPASGVSDSELDQFRGWLVEAWNKQDLDQIMSRLHPDIVVTWQDASISQGHDEVRKYIEEKTKGSNHIVEKVTANPVVEGRKIVDNQVYSWGHMNDVFVLKKDGESLPFDSRFSAVLIRDNGKLLLAGIHFSANVFNNPVLTLATFKTRTYAGVGGAIFGAIIALFLNRFMRKPVK